MERDELEPGINIHTLPYMKERKDFITTWNSSQCSVMRCVKKRTF